MSQFNPPGYADLAGDVTARIYAVTFPALSTTLQILTQPVMLMGFAIIETTGTAAAELDIINGRDTTGIEVFPVSLTAGQSTREGPWRYGVFFDSGVFLRARSGSIRGAMFFGLPLQSIAATTTEAMTGVVGPPTAPVPVGGSQYEIPRPPLPGGR